MVYEFNFALFVKTYGLPPLPTRSAMQLLTQSGYFEFIEEVTMQSRIMITAKKEEFYGICLDREEESVFNVILRSYTGLFADFVYINESVIARRAEASEQRVYETLLKLSRMHILQYIPRKSTPYLYYTTSRELPKYVALPLSVYEHQRDRLVKRIESMKRFAFADDECRVNVMLRYFGEKPEKDCGKCDVCRSRRPRKLAPDGLDATILYMVERQPRSLAYLINESSCRKEYVIAEVRRLVARGVLTVDSSMTVSKSCLRHED